jgi:quercetin dioxygenase-like cupin family protein
VTLVYQHELPNVRGRPSPVCSSNRARAAIHPATGHPKSALIYATVLEGAILSMVYGGPATVYKAGLSFFELPGDRHPVSANPSEMEPAKLLAVFRGGHDETELTIPLAE